MKRLTYPLPSEVVSLEADINYTILHLDSGKKIISSFTLKRFEERPEFSFFLRVNRGNLVNPEKIEKIEREGFMPEVILSNGSVLKVSRRRREVLIKFNLTNQ